MEDISDTTSEVSVGRGLLKELVELRALRTEKEMIQKTNQFYVQQLSQLEVKISEFKALAQAKEGEVQKLRNYIKQLDSERSYKDFSDTRSLCDLENKVALLEEEKCQMKDFSAIRVENERLKLELMHSNQVKDAYEAKFREAKVELLSLQSGESFDDGPTEDVRILRQQLEQSQLDHSRTINELEAERVQVCRLEKIIKDRDTTESQSAKELSEARLKNAGLEGQLTQLYEENKRLSELVSQQWRVSTGTISPIMMAKEDRVQPNFNSQATHVNERPTTLLSPRPQASENHPKQTLRPVLPATPSSLSSKASHHSSVKGTSQTAVYVPSFMRNKKPFFPVLGSSGSTHEIKPRQMQVTLDESDDDFEMSIPEEVHFYG